MKDIQSQVDHRRIDIKKVGVKTVTYPITVLDKAQSRQRTIAKVNMYVNLPHHFKGTHMSRFIEILNQFHGEIDMKGFVSILKEMKKRLDAEAAHVEMVFPFFLKRDDGSEVLQVRQYECTMQCFLEKEDDLKLDIVVPISHPFVKSDKEPPGAAIGLWGNAHVSVRFTKFMWLEDLIGIVETTIRTDPEGDSGKSMAEQPLESLLEKLAARFATLTELKWYSITVENVSQGYSLFATASSDSLPVFGNDATLTKSL